ncbi:MAG TPA: FAD-binding oxidoreductase [Ktedonobacterales bacterium]|jgi:FAD/FMN-containing dehydrogenase|nr:FAD-binding oxidoreductase [Ktedonobacterales bacterium]
MDTQALSQLKNRIAGDVITPDSPEYETRRRVLNRTGSPAVIVRAQSVEDIVATLRFAREQRLVISIRSGGHLLTGQATNDGGLALDMTRFNAVTLLDAEQRLVRIGAGAHWGEVATALAEHDLAISSGDTNQVGVGGLTLGGGIGWMVRTHGLTIDSLRAAELVTADGRVLRVSADEYPDLFWAIRGGGGNFGVVTSFDFEAQPCKGTVGGMVTYDTAEAHSVLTNWVGAMRDAPDDLNSTIVLFSGFGPQMPPQVMVLLCYAGDDETVARGAIEPFLRLGDVRSQDIQKKPYAAMLEDAQPLPPSFKMVGHNGFVRTLGSEVIEVVATHYGQAGAPIAQIRRLGGSMARVDPQATAFAHRENEALVVVPAFAPADAPVEQVQQMRQAAWGPLAPFSSGAYGNFLSEASAASVAAAYPGETYSRLARIKAIYDPENLFNQNLNIKPAAQG